MACGGSNTTSGSIGQVGAHAMKTIRQLRLERGWSQAELATRLEVTPHAVYMWERGRRVPRLMTMHKMEQLFGMNSDDIALIEKPSERGEG